MQNCGVLSQPLCTSAGTGSGWKRGFGGGLPPELGGAHCRDKEWGFRKGGYCLTETPPVWSTPNFPLWCRVRLSSDSDPEDAPATSGEGNTGGFPLPLPKGGSRVSSEESEEEGGEEPPRPPVRPPRPQAVSEGPPTPPATPPRVLYPTPGQAGGLRRGLGGAAVTLARCPPPQFCTFGSRLVTPGCYVFDRRLDRFCAALGSMLERHLSAHRWR